MSLLGISTAVFAAFAAPTCAETALPARPDISALAQSRRAIFAPLVKEAACRYGVSPLLLDALVVQESRYNPAAISHAGAIGLGQLMPGTARMLGVNPYDPRENLAGAARYLKQQLDEFGSVRLALAAYNAGPGRVRRNMSIPRIAETLNYVATIERDLARLGAGSSITSKATAPSFVRLSAVTEDEAQNVEGGEGSELQTKDEMPASWDVFARFRWEQNQKFNMERDEVDEQDSQNDE